MKKSQYTAIPVSGSCVFAMRRLLLQLDAFYLEMEGAKTGKNSEHIHRLRVASRRLRAALPICAPCVQKKRYRRWVDGIRTITRALSEARDADVQLEFLKKYEKRAVKHPGQDKRPPGADQPPITDGIEYLLGIYRKKRSALQKQVLSAITKLEKRRTIDDIRDAATGHLTAARRIRARLPMYALPALAADDISRRLGTLLSYEPYLQYPGAISEHHAMRIAAKKLRYTMEFYAPVYRYGLEKPLFRIKKVQELLGAIHDCDVWIDTVNRILVKERAEPHPPGSYEPMNPQVIADLKYFLGDRENERKILFSRLIRYWKNLKRTRIWDELRTALRTKIKKPFRPVPDPLQEKIEG
jgi:CHAD domain-containing protein